jgi:hypothetical protein
LEQLSVFQRLTLHLRGDDHEDGIATHGRSREFRMHMKNPAQTGSGCIRFNDLKIKRAVGIFKCGSRKEKYLGSVTIYLGQRKDHKISEKY